MSWKIDFSRWDKKRSLNSWKVKNFFFLFGLSAPSSMKQASAAFHSHHHFFFSSEVFSRMFFGKSEMPTCGLPSPMSLEGGGGRGASFFWRYFSRPLLPTPLQSGGVGNLLTPGDDDAGGRGVFLLFPLGGWGGVGFGRRRELGCKQEEEEIFPNPKEEEVSFFATIVTLCCLPIRGVWSRGKIRAPPPGLVGKKRPLSLSLWHLGRLVGTPSFFTTPAWKGKKTFFLSPEMILVRFSPLPQIRSSPLFFGTPAWSMSKFSTSFTIALLCFPLQ